MRKSSRAAGRQCAPLHPPPRSASASYLLDFEIILAKLYYFLFFFSYFKKVGDFPSTKALLGVNWSLHPLYLTKNLTIHRIDPDGCSKFWFPLQRDLIVAKPKSPILTVKSSWRKMSKQSQGFRRVTATTRCRILLLLYLTIPPFMYSSVYFIASLKTKRTLKFNSHLHNCVFCC